MRDPNGFRPLCLGRLDGGWVLASETPALDIVGAHFVREIDPGEMVVIDATASAVGASVPRRARRPASCACSSSCTSPGPTPSSTGATCTQARVRMGELLAEQAPVEADMVMGVPESAMPAAEGYARRSGIPYGQGLVKNRYIGRTFIAPSQELRARGVRMKLNPLRENIARQAPRRRRRLDRARHHHAGDRGHAARGGRRRGPPAHLVAALPLAVLLRHGHGRRVASCSLPTSTVDEIRDYIGADTLAYLDLDRLVTATGAVGAGFCTACLTGELPGARSA